MYRVFCESYKNYSSQFANNFPTNDYRFNIAVPMALIANPEMYNKEKENNSFIYMQVSDLLAYMEKILDRYPKLGAFLWTLESRGIKADYFGVSSNEDLEEQTKLINMFLDLLYWEDAKQ